MSSSVTQLPGEPILIVTLDLPLERHLESLRSVHAQLSRHAADTPGPLYVIIDVHGQAPAFSDILIGLDEVENAPEKWYDHSDAHLVIVSVHPIIDASARRIMQRLRIDFMRCDTLEQALAHVRALLAPPEPDQSQEEGECGREDLSEDPPPAPD